MMAVNLIIDNTHKVLGRRILRKTSEIIYVPDSGHGSPYVTKIDLCMDNNKTFEMTSDKVFREIATWHLFRAHKMSLWKDQILSLRMAL